MELLAARSRGTGLPHGVNEWTKQCCFQGFWCDVSEVRTAFPCRAKGDGGVSCFTEHKMEMIGRPDSGGDHNAEGTTFSTRFTSPSARPFCQSSAAVSIAHEAVCDTSSITIVIIALW